MLQLSDIQDDLANLTVITTELTEKQEADQMARDVRNVFDAELYSKGSKTPKGTNESIGHGIME